MRSNVILIFPLKILLIWNILTLVLFVLSPFDWPIDFINYLTLLLFVSVCLSFLYFGYNFGLKNNLKIAYNPPTNLVLRWFNISFLIRLIWILPSYCDRLGLDLLDFKALFLRLALGFSNIGESYAYRFLIEPEKSGILFFVLKQVLYSMSALTIPLGIMLWRKISVSKKIVLVGFVFIDIIYWMGIGTNVGVVNNFLIIFFMLVVIFPQIADITRIKLRYKLYISALLVLILFLFTLNISQRYEYNYKGNYSFYESEISNAKINKNSFILRFTPESIHGTIISLSGYLNQGYYHTTMAFDEDFDWTYGIGNNFTTLGIAPKIVGEDLLPKTYIGKLERKGVDPMINWHTAYLWFANDFTFLGVPFVLFFIGLLFSVSWKSTLRLNDPFAPVIFIFCVTEIFYLIGNNVVFSFSFYQFHIILIAWFIIRLIYAKKREFPQNISC